MTKKCVTCGILFRFALIKNYDHKKYITKKKSINININEKFEKH